MRISHHRFRIEIEQTTVRLQWEEGQMPPDGGHQMAADFLAASQKLLNEHTCKGTSEPAKNSDPSDENP